MSAFGESDVSAEVAVSTSPGVATGLSSTLQTTSSIALSWTAPTIATGSAVTGYKVYSRVVQADATGVALQAGGGTDGVVIDTLVYDGRTDVTAATDPTTELNALSGGSLYTYVVGVVSAAGESDRSASLDVSTSAPAPSGLTSVSQTTTGMELSWTAPVISTGEAVTGYKVYRDDGADGAVDVVAYDSRQNSGDFEATSCSVSGLTGGLTYKYQVAALSLAGESDRSVEMSSPTSPFQVSGVSSTLQTTDSITLTWSAPAASAGNDASGYMVYRNDGLSGSTEMSTVAYDGSSSTSVSGVVSGLVGGRKYSFVVSAMNGGGEGDVSDVLDQSTSPAAPSVLQSTLQTTTSITLSWAAPVTETGGADVIGYVLYRNDGSADGAVTIEVYEAGAAADATMTTSMTSTEVTGLSGGVEYQFSVAARSLAGLGDRSSVVSVSTSSDVAAAPVATHQTASSLTLSWSAPTVSTGGVATGYRLYLVTDGAGSTEPVYTSVYDGAESTATTTELTSLISGSSYRYVLSTMSASGESDVSAEVAVSTSPGVATGLLSTLQTTSSIALSWTAPTIYTGSAVTGYKVYSRVVQSGTSGVVPSSTDVVQHFL
ncbi:MAG: fibronectin type III domain-containing protein, partial [Burkholderiales bacterium]